MKIRLLGTGGADGIPGFFACNRVSKYAFKHGGRDVRSRTAALVDSGLKIDLGPDTRMQMLREGLDSREWSAVYFTHSHEDHLAVSEIQYALYPFIEQDHLNFTIYGNETVLGVIRQRYPEWPLDLVTTRSFLTYTHGPYRITPVKATHTFGEDCQNPIIERGGKTLLYGSDTGIWSEETFEFLSHYKLDVLILECSEGFVPTDYHGHLDVESCIQMVEKLRAFGILAAGSRVVTTHHAHSGEATHCELEEALLPHGIEPGFDGMVIEF